MESFDMNKLSDEQKSIYKRFMCKIIPLGRINSSLEPYTHLSRCWSHTTVPSSNGYGQMMINKIQWNLHRLSFWIHNGFPDLETFKGKHIRHKCDNRECSNPEHLEIGTPTENMKDMWERGGKQLIVKEVIRNSKPCVKCIEAHKKCKNDENCSLEKRERISHNGDYTTEKCSGENNVKAKLTWDIVNEIRNTYKSFKYGEKKKVAEKYGITTNSLDNILNYKTWLPPKQ